MWKLGPGFHPIYLTANNGREPLYFYWAVWFVDVLRDVPFALRLSSAFLGIATIPAVYFAVSQMLRKAEGLRTSRSIALFSAAVCAFLFFHLNFSRIGLRTISLPLLECLAFGLLWRAFHTGRRRNFTGAGIFAGLCLYSYTAARLLVPALVLFGLYWLLTQKRIERPVGLAASLGAFAVTVLPLGAYALRNQAEFFQRTQGVAVLNRQEILENVRNIAEMFFIRGSLNGAHNIPGMPMFDWPMRAAFVVGLGLLLVRLRRPVYVFLVIWFAVLSLASAFSPDAPYYIRLTAIIPPSAVIPALALAQLPAWLAWLARRLRPAWPARVPASLALLPSAAAVAASGAITYHHYFDVWGPSNDTYFWMMQDKVDAASSLKEAIAQGDHVFLAPLFAQDWTFLALTRGQDIQTFDVKDCYAVPAPGVRATYAFPPYDVTQPEALRARLPASATEAPVLNALGQPVLIDVRLPAGAVPPSSAPPVGNFGGQIALLRVDGLPSGPVSPGTTLKLTFVWQALSRPQGAYTTFIHADNLAQPRRIQQDRPPCSGTFPTYAWRTGDRVFDPHELSIPKDAAPGEYRVATGLYSQPGPVNLTLQGTNVAELPVGSFSVVGSR